MGRVALFYILQLVVAAIATDKCTRFSVVSPQSAVPGQGTAVLVYLGGTEPANVTLRLLATASPNRSGPELIAHNTVIIQGEGTVPLSVPSQAGGDLVLETLVGCGGDNAGCLVQSASPLRLVGGVRDVLIRPWSKYYKPGETVEFWVLALDHDLRMATDVTGSVYLKDPTGTKVSIWEEVPLDEGVKGFSMSLSEEARTGLWSLEVVVGTSSFSSPLNVSLTRGSRDPALPELPIAEEHYVELDFSKEMRRRYKPGLPFVGKVEAASSEKAVRVRVKVLDNTTAIYSQDIEMPGGEGSFLVPAILSDSQVITLQAELVSVGGKEIDSHYVLAREPVYKWNSTSSCYLLVEGLQASLQPGDEAKAIVLSSCPCDRDLHYLVTTEGHVTYWNEQRIPPVDLPPEENINGTPLCRFNFTFTVEAVMAPVSHLLVYYVTDQGEPISDVISFDVKLFQRQILTTQFSVQSISVDKGTLRLKWKGQMMTQDVDLLINNFNITLGEDPYDAVLRPEHLRGQVDTQTEVERTDDDARRGPPNVSVNIEQKKFWYPGQAMDLQILSDLGSLVCLVGGRGADVHSQKIKKGIEVELSEAGVSYFWDDCAHQEVRPARPGHHHTIMSEAGLDQLWLWNCFNYTSDVEARGLKLTAPPEPGKWSLGALSVSLAMGLRFSYPTTLTVFQPIEVEFRLPPAFRVGESLEVDIRIGNNLNSCVDVNALLTLSEGAHFLGSSQPFVAEKLRLGPHGATSLVVRVVATSPGLKNMTVEVSAYNSDTCQSLVAEKMNHTMVGTVSKLRTILVNPEGLVKTHIESAYFCANEQMVISTAEEFKYEFIQAPRNREAIVFEVKAGKGLHIGLSELRDTSYKMYQVVIGDLDNSVSWIGRGKHGYSVHLLTRSTPQILSSDESRTFWLSWDQGVLSFGRGPSIHESVILKWRREKKMKVNFLGFATTWGQAAEVRVWNFNDEAGFSQVLHLDIPHTVLPGSETGTLMVAGGLSLPSLRVSPRPSLSEYSSLATTISSIAPLLADEGLKLHMNQTKNGERKDLIRNLSTNIQKLLLFKKTDNSFSDHHNMTSLWNSVEVLDLLSRVQSIMSVDPGLVRKLKEWVRKYQESDGSFKAHFIDINPDNTTNMSELDKTIATTSDTLAALISVGIENEVDSVAIQKAKGYLEAHVASPTDGCALAMLCLALVSVKSERVPAALERLRNASTNEEGEFGWPRPHDNSDWLYEEGIEQKKQPPISLNTHLKEFKASLYALMTYTSMGDLKSAEPVARYLFYRANILDTHTELIFTAVKAFSEFGLLALDPNRWLTVSLATSGMELTDTLELRANSPPQVLSLPSLPTKVFVYATGAGCATVQGQISYATYSSTKSTSLFDLWAGVTEEILPRRNSIQELEGKLPLLNIKTCFKWKGGGVSGVVRLEVHLFSGFELLSVQPNEMDIDYGSRGDRLWFVVSNVSSHCAVCIEFTAKSDYIIGRLRPGFARVYPSGRADLASELFFHTRRGSPLLSETSEDDLITWFGSARAGESDGMSSDFSEICACGQVCVDEPPVVRATTVSGMEEHTDGGDEGKQEESSDFTDIIVFSDLHENLSTTEGEFRTIEDLTRELGLNATTGGFTIGQDPSIELDMTSTFATTELPTTYTTHTTEMPTTYSPTTETPTTMTTRGPTQAPSAIPTKTPQKITVTPKITAKEKIISKPNKSKIPIKTKYKNKLTIETPIEPVQGSPEYKREKHIDIIKINLNKTVLSTLPPPFINHPELLKQLTQNNHIIIRNLTDTNPEPTGKHVNKQLKEISQIDLAESMETPLPNVEETAELAKDSRQSLLEHGHETPLEILRGQQTDRYQARSPAG